MEIDKEIEKIMEKAKRKVKRDENMKKHELKVYVSIKQEIRSEIDELRRNKEKFAELCRRIRETEEKKKKIQKWQHHSTSVMEKEMNPMLEKEIVLRKHVEKAKETERKIFSKLNKASTLRLKVEERRFDSVRFKKLGFLVVLLSRLQYLRTKLIERRKEKALQLRREHFEFVINEIFIPYIKRMRRNKMMRLFRVWRYCFKFQYKFLIVLKRREASNVIRTFLSALKETQFLRRVCLKFVSVTKSVQAKLSNFIKWRRARFVLRVCQVVLKATTVSSFSGMELFQRIPPFSILQHEIGRIEYRTIRSFLDSIVEAYEFHSIEKKYNPEKLSWIVSDSPSVLLPDGQVNSILALVTVSFDEVHSSKKAEEIEKYGIECQKTIDFLKQSNNGFFERIFNSSSSSDQ